MAIIFSASRLVAYLGAILARRSKLLEGSHSCTAIYVLSTVSEPKYETTDLNVKTG